MNPDRVGTDAGSILALWRRVGRPEPRGFAEDFGMVCEWAQLSGDPLAARDIRAEGWADGRDRSREIVTLARQDRWSSRLDAARAWDERGRVSPRVEPAPAAASKLTPAQAARAATMAALDRAAANLSTLNAGGPRHAIK